MTTFQSVNVHLGSRDHASDATTPTTPRGFLDHIPLPPPPTQPRVDSTATTPTRNSFSAAASAKRGLPVSPFAPSFPQQQQTSGPSPPKTLTREDSNRSVKSTGSQDVEMDESDEGEDGSDGESIDGETGRPSKKKKGQRFFCTEFPPCSLSFTRSEHLARHIRKHTGERPFQCHCARRFSRLDNLRQHAQTVHVNEEIPGDSLAATGTRFQRQIRTDRVRPPGPRSRASTASSQGGHSRGHSRNLSASSIGSTASNISRDDGRRRPQPLMMAHDPSNRARLTIDTMRSQVSTPPNSYTYANQGSAGPSTPTSTTYSNGPGSPYGSSIGSPMSTVSRSVGIWSGQPSARRLSVPSGANPFQGSQVNIHGPQYFSPLSPTNASSNSSNTSLFASPTSSTYSFSRHEPSNAAEADWRRRTWHPSTYSNYPRPATSGLSFYRTPDAPQPAFAPQASIAAGQSQRLPGIETFDQISNRPKTPPRTGSGPMQIENRPPLYSATSERSIGGPIDRRGHASWDMSLHTNLTKLDIANGTPPKDVGTWGKQVLAEIQHAGSASAFRPTSQQPSLQSPSLGPSQESQKRPTEIDHYPQPPQPQPQPQPATPNRSKRNGWYNGPLPASQQVHLTQRPSPEDSSSSEGVPTPSASSAEYHPSIVHANGYIETLSTAPRPTAAYNHNTTTNNNNHPASTSYHPSVNPTLQAYATTTTTQQNYTFAATQQAGYPLLAEQRSAMQIPKNADMSGLEALVAVATSEEKAPRATHR